VRVSDRPMARGRSKPCAAGPSVEVGPALSKQNKTVAGRSARCETRGAKEGEDRQEELRLEALRRAAAAGQFIDRVLSVASQAVEESRARKEPLLAMAGRFTRPDGCGCDRCAEIGGGADGEGVLALRKCKLNDAEQEAMVRLFQAGWEDDWLVPEGWNGSWSAEQLLEDKLSGWFPNVGCGIMTHCGAGIHPAVDEALDEDQARGGQVLRRNFWIQMLDDFVEQHGSEVVFPLWSMVPPLPASDNDGMQQAACMQDQRAARHPTLVSFDELCEEEMDFEGEESAEEETAEALAEPVANAFWLPLKAILYLLTAVGTLVGIAVGLLLAAGRLLWFVLASGASLAWRGLLYGGVTVPVSIGVRLVFWVRQAREEIVLAAEAGALTPVSEEEVHSTIEDGAEDEEGGGVDPVEDTGSKEEAVRGQGARNRKKAVSVAGRRRRMASARQQNKVWDPGD
jgi:hypothetical protein